MGKSRKDKSEKKSSSGGKSKKRAAQLELLGLPKGRPPLYDCVNCGTPLHPDFVWYIETVGDHTDHIYVTHHCRCCYSDPEMRVAGRYKLQGYHYAVAFLMQFSQEYLHHSVNGGWTWENPHRQYVISSQCVPLEEMRQEMAHCHDVSDFVRLCGKGWPDGLAPVPA